MLREEHWQNMNDELAGFGSIDKINLLSTDSNSKIYVNRSDSPIEVDGWGIFSKKDVEVYSAYVFIDNTVNTKAHYGFLHQDRTTYGEKTKPSFYSGIGGVVDLHKLSDGCHNISIRIVNDDKYCKISTGSQICIK